jgi:glucose-6-phosphate 1-epimerase
MASDYQRFSIPGIIDVTTGNGGLPLLRIHNEHAECEIYLYGAHVSRFKRAGQADLLWMSPTGLFKEGSAIRGGIPICFPWFGPHPTRSDLPLHGVARIRIWDLESTAQLADGRTRVVLRCSDDEKTQAVWPHRFNLELTVTIGADLEVSLFAENTGRDPFRYDDCFHTYFKVGDPYRCDIEGFDGVGYIDRVHGDTRAVQKGSLRLSAETVNAYMRSPAVCELRDPLMKRRIFLEHKGFADTVVWNPGEATAAKNGEIGATWKEFLCIESANCLDTPVFLLPGSSHRSTLRLRIEEDR